MNNLIFGFLLKFWDAFKAKNPVVATFIVLVLGTVIYFAEQGTLLGAFDLPDWAAGAVKWLAIALGFLTGSRTSQALAELKNK